jgi:hypothetical protein
MSEVPPVVEAKATDVPSGESDECMTALPAMDVI